jgi:hypothetical protein
MSMQRVSVTETTGDGKVRLTGWFDYDKAEAFAEATYWDGSRHASVNTSHWAEGNQTLLRTSQGRWILAWKRAGQQDTFCYLSDETAQEWLIRNHRDDDVERFFGRLEDERGPGRPEIGEAINVRLGDRRLADVDAFARKRGLTRAAALRDLVDAGLTTLVAATDPAE